MDDKSRFLSDLVSHYVFDFIIILSLYLMREIKVYQCRMYPSITVPLPDRSASSSHGQALIKPASHFERPVLLPPSPTVTPDISTQNASTTVNEAADAVQEEALQQVRQTAMHGEVRNVSQRSAPDMYDETIPYIAAFSNTEQFMEPVAVTSEREIPSWMEGITVYSVG
jgi:hypothetical protein